MPVLSIKPPTIVHHMAALDDQAAPVDQAAPPNSLAAIRACLGAGAAFVEVDVTALARDDYLLVHDDALEAETSGQGAVGEAVPEQMRGLYLKGRNGVSEYPPALLGEVVDLFLETPGATRLQLDYKNAIPFASDEPLERLIRLIQPLGERVLVSSGADWQLRKLRKMAPWLLLGFDAMWYIGWQPSDSSRDEPRDPRDFPKKLGAYGYYDDHILASEVHWPAAEYLRDRCESLIGLVPDVSVFYLEHHLLAQSLRDKFNWAESLHAHGIKLDAWTMDVTSPAVLENAPRLLAAGVDLFTSNTPLALGRMLGRRQG